MEYFYEYHLLYLFTFFHCHRPFLLRNSWRPLSHLCWPKKIVSGSVWLTRWRRDSGCGWMDLHWKKGLTSLWQHLLQINKMAHFKSKCFCSLSFSLKFWTTKEPDNWEDEDPQNGEDCASIGQRSNGNSWYDRTCKYLQRSICEKPGMPGYLMCAGI